MQKGRYQGRVLLPFVVAVFFISANQAFAECTPWIARIVSVQGTVEAKRTGTSRWEKADLNQKYCAGDSIRVLAKSRASLELSNETLLRLDQNSTLLLSTASGEPGSVLELLEGAVHTITRVPRSLKIKTPYVNAAVEGTEFVVHVLPAATLVAVLEGHVAVSNAHGRLLLAQSQSALTREGEAPVLRLDIKPQDAVHWSLYYPSILTLQQKAVGTQIRLAESEIVSGNTPAALQWLDALLAAQPENADALALKSIVMVVQNRKDEALILARKAVAAQSDAVSAHLALSYVLQAHFDLQGAREAVLTALKNDSKLALAWARLAELELALGDLDKALASARQAESLNPQLSRIQAVLGFARLSNYNVVQARQAFEKAIQLDSSDPLARLGNGLALIREGSLVQGRREIEIAASLDPQNAMIRSYLGKAYHEEKRNRLAARQFDMAKQLDPKDPTPWLYDAMRKQGENRPVEALRDLQRSIALNNNRAVFRSRFQLDDDLATRGVGVGRIYQELGFEQLALIEASKSLSQNPANYTAHRLLADAYLAKSRHEIARVSELLQSQMLQPINTTPLQPQMGESSLTLLNNLGTSSAAYNQYNSLFLRNQQNVNLNLLSAGNNTVGGEAIYSAVYNNFSASLGRYHYKTDGFHSNNEDRQNLYDVFLQYAVNHKTSLLFEASRNDREYGDILRFDPANFSRSLNNIDNIDRRRIGVSYSFSPRSKFLFTVMTDKRTEEKSQSSGFVSVHSIDRSESKGQEFRYIFSSNIFNYTAGVQHTSSDVVSDTQLITFLGPISSPPSLDDISDNSIYWYGYYNAPELNITIGVSRSHYESRLANLDDRYIAPKFGVEFSPIAKTTIRAAVFKTYRRPLLNNQTLEPTSISGFNQFYDDNIGTQADNKNLALDIRISQKLLGGVEYLQRDMVVPYLDKTVVPSVNRTADSHSKKAKFFLYWLPTKSISITSSISREVLMFDSSVVGNSKIQNTKIYRLPIGMNWFSRSGWVGRFSATFVHQKGDFVDVATSGLVQGRDSFYIFDGSLDYKMRNKIGVISVGVLNLTNEEFRFQDTDPSRQLLSPERLAFLRLSFAF